MLALCAYYQLHVTETVGGVQALDSTEEPIPAAVKAVLKAKVELLVRKVTAQQKAAAAAKQVLCPRQ